METEIKPIPAGYHSLTPYLIVTDGREAVDWYARAFQAKIFNTLENAEGNFGHAELEIGDSRFMLTTQRPELGIKPPQGDGNGVSLVLYVENADEFFSRAVDNGAIIIHPLKDQFYGDRMGVIKDPFGHVWNISTHIEDVPLDKIRAKAKEM